MAQLTKGCFPSTGHFNSAPVELENRRRRGKGAVNRIPSSGSEEGDLKTPANRKKEVVVAWRSEKYDICKVLCHAKAFSF